MKASIELEQSWEHPDKLVLYLNDLIGFVQQYDQSVEWYISVNPIRSNEDEYEIALTHL